MKSQLNKFGQKELVFTIVTFTCLTFFSGLVMAQAVDEETGYTDQFRTQDCTFIDEGENTYYILRPGYQMVLKGVEDGEDVVFVHTVLDETRMFYLPDEGWVTTRVIEELEWADGIPVEFTHGFFALCKETGDLYDFGDEVDIYNDDGTEIESHDGTWHAGEPDKNGLAKPGIFMPGSFMLKARYYQQMAEGMSMERAENWEMGLTIETPAGTFTDCVRVRETNWSEPEGAETFKTHAPGVGLLGEDTLELVAFGYNIFDRKTGKLIPQYKGEIIFLR